jgi:hypothetical protein
MSIAPLVRRVIVCRKVEVTNPGPSQEYVIRGVITSVRPRTGITFPYREKDLWVFIQYSDGAGTHNPTLELVRMKLESEEVIATWRLPPIHMTAGRFAVLSRAHRLKSVPFPEPGVYEFRVRCAGNLASDEVRVEDRP